MPQLERQHFPESSMPVFPKENVTPYADAIIREAAKDDIRLMVPGHQNAPDHPLIRLLGTQGLSVDISPLINGIDKGPNNPLQQSLTLAAEAFRARKTWFLTNGASQANRMIGIALGHTTKNGKVLTQRSTHSSFIDGMIIGGVDAIFLNPSIDYHHGIHHGITPEQVKNALAARKDIKAVYIVSPSYFGAVADIKAIADIAHEHELPLIVDGSWGTHFGFACSVPANPLDMGADVLVSSVHKLGGSLTQSAMLHIANSTYAAALEEHLDQAFHLTQSTSASALLLASLDIARADLQSSEETINAAVAKSELFRAAVRNTKELSIVSDTFLQYADIADIDPLHLSIDISGLGITGHEAQNELHRRHGIYAEIATSTCLVFILGIHHDYDIDTIINALLSLKAEDLSDDTKTLKLPCMSESSMSIRDAYYSDTEVVAYEDAIGRISAESLAAYPPGIPNVLPGEIITEEIAVFLKATAETPGGWVRGAVNPQASAFRVVK